MEAKLPLVGLSWFVGALVSMVFLGGLQVCASQADLMSYNKLDEEETEPTADDDGFRFSFRRKPSVREA